MIKLFRRLQIVSRGRLLRRQIVKLLMTVRTKATIIIVAGVVVIAVIIGGFIWLNRADQPLAEMAPAPKAELDDTTAEVVKIAPPTVAEKQAASIGAVAKTFVERFGSYSNQSGYSSLAELEALSTESFAAWLESNCVPKLKKEHDPSGYYYEISTEAPMIASVEQSATAAKFVVTTQRIEKTDNGEKTFQQDIVLDMKKIGDEWRGGGAYWQKKKKTPQHEKFAGEILTLLAI